MIGHAAHGNRNTFFLVTRGKRYLQFARGEDGIVKKKLVKITQTKEEQRAGMLFLDGGILPHQRRGRLGHFGGVRGRIITKGSAQLL